MSFFFFLNGTTNEKCWYLFICYFTFSLTYLQPIAPQYSCLRPKPFTPLTEELDFCFLQPLLEEICQLWTNDEQFWYIFTCFTTFIIKSFVSLLSRLSVLQHQKFTSATKSFLKVSFVTFIYHEMSQCESERQCIINKSFLQASVCVQSCFDLLM